MAIRVLSIEVASADAKITDDSFSTSIRFQALFFNGSAEINAFTHNGRSTFTGAARLNLEVKKGSIVQEGPCGPFGRVNLCPPAIPPFNIPRLASLGADVGEFTNGQFGFK